MPPSEKITFAYIGCGTQGLREMLDMLAMPEMQIVAVCDPNQGQRRLRGLVARTACGGPSPRGWASRSGGEGTAGDPGGPGRRQGGRGAVLREQERPPAKFKGCAAYADFRELLEKEKDLDAVKIMTPDHLHATIAIAAMKKGKHVMMHKPLANRLQEARLVIETARKTKVATHFLPASAGEQVRTVARLDQGGRHRHAARDPQLVEPAGVAAVRDDPDGHAAGPEGLRLGPVARTVAASALSSALHAHGVSRLVRVRRRVDGGHGPLQPLAGVPGVRPGRPGQRRIDAEPRLHDRRPTSARTIKNDYSFPPASTIRFKFAAKGDRPAVDLFWYDGGMKPPTPEELEADNKELPAEGMMFVGDKGKILAGFRCENPRIIPEQRPREFEAAKAQATPPPQERGRGRAGRDAAWVKAFKGGEPTYGDFLAGRTDLRGLQPGRGLAAAGRQAAALGRREP